MSQTVFDGRNATSASTSAYAGRSTLMKLHDLADTTPPLNQEFVDEFSVEDLLAETAALVDSTATMTSATSTNADHTNFDSETAALLPFNGEEQIQTFGGYLPRSAARMLGSSHNVDAIVAESDEVQALRVENMALKAKVEHLEREVVDLRAATHAKNNTATQYQKLFNVLRIRNTELETQVRELSAKVVHHDGTVGKLNDLILRQDSTLKHIRKVAIRKIGLAKKKVQVVQERCRDQTEEALHEQHRRHLDVERQLRTTTRYLQGQFFF